MSIATSTHSSTGTRSRVPVALRAPRRVAIKVSADVEFFGNEADTDGFPWTADDGEFAPDLGGSDTLWVEGTATLYIMEWSR